MIKFVFIKKFLGLPTHMHLKKYVEKNIETKNKILYIVNEFNNAPSYFNWKNQAICYNAKLEVLAYLLII